VITLTPVDEGPADEIPTVEDFLGLPPRTVDDVG
jgi:hypothetical protein